jgi:TonB family protein
MASAQGSGALSSGARRWVRWIQSGRLLYVTTVLPFLTLMPALFILSWTARDTIPVVSDAQTTRFEFSLTKNAPQSRSAPTPDSSAGKTRTAAAATGGARAEPDLLNDYLVGVMGLVDRAKRYPRRERSEQIEGDVVVRMRLDRSGALLAVEIVGPSSREGFNRAALDAVRRAAPFPSMPEGVQRERVGLRLKLRFRLR